MAGNAAPGTRADVRLSTGYRPQLDRPVRGWTKSNLALPRAKPNSLRSRAAHRALQAPHRLDESLITVPDKKFGRIQDRALAALQLQSAFWPVTQAMGQTERWRVHLGRLA
jgi:hypothetical protein